MRKTFDLEKAKAGAKVVTRDGRPVEILKYNYIQRGTQRLIVCSKDEDGDDNVYVVNSDGSWIVDMEHNADIFLEVEPTYHPYSSVEEMDKAIKEHGMFIKHKEIERRIAIIAYTETDIETLSDYEDYKSLLKYYTWLDGTPCGVMEGGTNE